MERTCSDLAGRAGRAAARLFLGLLLAGGAAAGQDAAAAALDELFAAARAGRTAALEQGLAALRALPDGTSRLAAALATGRAEPEIVMGLRALKALGDPGDGGALLVKLCAHESAAIRSEALATGAALAPGALLVPALDLASDPAVEVRRRAFDVLIAAASSDPRVLEAALGGARDPDFWIMGHVFRILNGWPAAPAGAADPVALGLERGLEKLASAALPRAFALLASRLGEGVGPILERAFKSRRAAIVVEALRTAGRLKLVRLAPAGQKLLGESDPAVLAEAARFLGSVRARDAAPDLVALLDGSEDSKVREAAAVALRLITGRTFGYDVAGWRRYLAGER